MKQSYSLIHLVIVSILLATVVACEIPDKKEEERRNAELAEMEQRRLREMQRRRLEIERESQTYYDDYDSPSSDATYRFLESERNYLWIQSEYGNFDGYYEYGDPDGVIEGIVMSEYVGETEDFEELSPGDYASDVESSFHNSFPQHKASSLIYRKTLHGEDFDIQYYEHQVEQKKAHDVDVEAIYSVDMDGERVLIVVERGSQSTRRFSNDYEKFVLSLTTE